MDYDALYEKYEEQLKESYQAAKEAIEDGLDFSDIKDLGDIIEDIVEIINELQDELTLQEKKDFLVHIAMKLYYEQKLPWYLKIGLVKHFIKKKVRKLVDKALDYLYEKGIVKKTEM